MDNSIPGQMNIFDFIPEPQQQHSKVIAKDLKEPEVGEWVESHGAIICHIMRKSYIGKKVIIDKSTQTHKWFRCGILEEYFECRGVMRSVVFTGEKQRHLIDHYEGINIYEPLPWDAYPERMKAIFGRKYVENETQIR